jgi:biotin-(acetyl-CoA carboxylase) ligase
LLDVNVRCIAGILAGREKRKRMQYLLCVKGIGINYENITKVLNMYRPTAN